MFSDMQAAFSKLKFSEGQLLLQRFLAQFDTIFTLNQDTFLETFYAGPVRWSERWCGSYLPYMKLIETPPQHYTFKLRAHMTPEAEFVTQENCQPIYKLHGSYNWFSEPNGERLLVMGGNKIATIRTFPVLARYQAAFQTALSQPDTKLMVIGYSFGDLHINSVIEFAAGNGLKLFVIDPYGVDVIDKRDTRAQIPEPLTDLMNALMPRFIGASRRTLNEVIFGDLVENTKVMRFFDGQAEARQIKD